MPAGHSSLTGMDSNALDRIKSTRRGGGRRTRSTTGAPSPTLTPDAPVSQQIQRALPFLFDPAEMPIVVESGGHLPPADFEEFYVVAAVDGNRTVTPEGCTTPVSSRLWSVGQHVRRDVYAAYLKELGDEVYQQWLADLPAELRPEITVPLPADG
jgi:hypothetical protein